MAEIQKLQERAGFAGKEEVEAVGPWKEPVDLRPIFFRDEPPHKLDLPPL